MIRKTVADYPLAMIALLLTAFGIAVVYSAGQTDYPSAIVQAAWMRQLAWLGVGLVAFRWSRACRCVSSSGRPCLRTC